MSVLNGSEHLLEVRALQTHFFTEDGVLKAVDGVDFNVRHGEIFGLVGESGCGKSVTALSIMQLIDKPGKIVAGEVYFRGIALHELAEDEMNDLRGKSISMIFQQPLSNLNPVFPGGAQVAEVLRIHLEMSKKEAWERAIELYKTVGIPDAEEKVNAYAHELSGGQAQRVMIAIATATAPVLLIADEPTTALDVTIQSQIFDLLRELCTNGETSILLITHDLGVIAEIAHRVAVMYAGRIFEESDVGTLFEEPLHPYTTGLMGSMPIPGRPVDRLDVIPGNVPNLIDLPSGCRFAPRCRSRVEYDLKICTEHEPDLIQAKEDHYVRCWLYQDKDDHKAPIEV